VAERKTKIVQEMVRTMLNQSKISNIFWRDVVHIVFYILNRAQIQANNDKKPYELWKGRSKNVKHLKNFGRKCYIKRDNDNLGKFDSICDEGIFLGYSSQRKDYICLNMRLDKIVENENVRVDDEKMGRNKMQTNDQPTTTNYNEKEKDNDEDNIEEEEEEEKYNEKGNVEVEKYNEEYNAEEEEAPGQDTKTPSRYVQKNHLEKLILGENNKVTQTDKITKT